MSSEALAQELRRLADEAKVARERLAEIGRELAELAAALPAPEPAPESGESPRLQSVP